MKLSVNIKNNDFNNNSMCIRNIRFPDQGEINVKITENVVSNDAILIDNIFPNVPSDSRELVLKLQTELKQLKSEYQQNQKEINDIISALDASTSHTDILNRVIEGAAFLMQSTISGIIGNSAYTLLKNILFPTR